MSLYNISIMKERETKAYHGGGANLKDEFALTLKWFRSSEFKFLPEKKQEQRIKKELHELDKQDIRFDKDINNKELVRVTEKPDYNQPIIQKEMKIPKHLRDEGGFLG